MLRATYPSFPTRSLVGVVQDSLETAINSSGDVLFCVTAEYRDKLKKGEEIDI